MRMIHKPDAAPQIAALITNLTQKQAEIHDVEIDGWVIRRPSAFEVDEHFGVMIAESQIVSAPLDLPHTDLELCVAVLEGEIRLQGYAGTLKANQFFVVRPKDGRTIVAVQHPTKISAFFFRGQDVESAMDSSAAA